MEARRNTDRFGHLEGHIVGEIRQFMRYLSVFSIGLEFACFLVHVDVELLGRGH